MIYMHKDTCKLQTNLNSQNKKYDFKYQKSYDIIVEKYLP